MNEILTRGFLTGPGSNATPGGLTPTGGVITWTLAQSWATVYSQIVTVNGPVICLVEVDPSGGSRQMTNNGGNPTNLWNVLFMSFPNEYGNSANNAPTPPFTAAVSVDAGFQLGRLPNTTQALLMSKNIYWTFDTTGGPIVPSPGGSIPVSGLNVSIQLDGGAIGNTTGPLLNSSLTTWFLSNGAILHNNDFAASLVHINNGTFTSVVMSTSAALGGPNIFDAVAAATVNVYVDPTTRVQSNTFGANVTPAYNNSQLTLFDNNGRQWTGTINNAGVLSWV